MDYICCIDNHLLWPWLVELALYRAPCTYVETKSHCSADGRLEHFSQYYEVSDGGHEQLSLAESCANFSGFGLQLYEKRLATPYSVRNARIGSRLAAMRAGSSAAKNAAVQSTSSVTDRMTGS
jgi:hypothetical protein